MNTKLFLLAMSSLLLSVPLMSTDSRTPSTHLTRDQIVTDSSINKDLNSFKSNLNQMKEDKDINLEVKRALMADKELAPFINKIIIQADKGVVTLTGKVNSSDMKSKIVNKVGSLPGVVKVVNNLEVIA